MALTPSCMACQEGISLPDEWIENTCGPNACDVEYAGWDDEARQRTNLVVSSYNNRLGPRKS